MNYSLTHATIFVIVIKNKQREKKCSTLKIFKKIQNAARKYMNPNDTHNA